MLLDAVVIIVIGIMFSFVLWSLGCLYAETEREAMREAEAEEEVE